MGWRGVGACRGLRGFLTELGFPKQWEGEPKQKKFFAIETNGKEVLEAASLGCWTQGLAITFQWLVGLWSSCVCV